MITLNIKDFKKESTFVKQALAGHGLSYKPTTPSSMKIMKGPLQIGLMNGELLEISLPAEEASRLRKTLRLMGMEA